MTNNNQKLNNVVQQCRETGVKLPESMLALVANLLSSTPLSFAVFPTLRQSIQIEHETEDSYIEFEIFDDKIIMLRMTDDRIDPDQSQEEREVTDEEMYEIVWRLEK